MNNNWCKGYCFKEDKHLDAKKVCNKPNCHNKKRAEQLVQQSTKKISENLLKEVEKNLY